MSQRRRPSPAVYRRRRLLVLVLAVLIVGGIVWLAVAQPWRGAADQAGEAQSPSSPAPAASAGPTPEATPGATPSATPGAPQACEPSALEVTGLADQGEYAAGEEPRFSIELVNTGDVDCLLNVGTTTQRFTVTSGADTWWTSTDCQSEPSDMEVTLAAGQTVTSAEPVVWDRTRSSVDTCDSDTRPAAPSAGASYHLQVEIGGVESRETTQFVLN